MAHFEIIEGAPGQGKSLYTAKKTYDLAKRNLKWFKKGRPLRYIYSNLKFSEKFEDECMVDLIELVAAPVGEPVFQTKKVCMIQYWTDTQQLCTLKDCDIVWDEIATELDSRNFANLTVELKRFLSQYRKRGVDIYANTQDFSMIDARARLMISHCSTLIKIIGSPDPSTTKPVVKNVWGLILIRSVLNYREVDPEKKKYEFVPTLMLIERKLVDLYDTRQDIPLGRQAPLKHIDLVCEFHDVEGHTCSFKKTIHQ